MAEAANVRVRCARFCRNRLYELSELTCVKDELYTPERKNENSVDGRDGGKGVGKKGRERRGGLPLARTSETDVNKPLPQTAASRLKLLYCIVFYALRISF